MSAAATAQDAHLHSVNSALSVIFALRRLPRKRISAACQADVIYFDFYINVLNQASFESLKNKGSKGIPLLIHQCHCKSRSHS
jgi:hypothetical protein